MSYSVKLLFEDDHEVTISCRPDEDVITAALRQGLILMSECREGVCSTCKSFLADGEYDELLPYSVYALSPSEEEEGYVLCCRLRPRSDMEIELDYPSSMIHQFHESERRGVIEDIAMVSDTVARLAVRLIDGRRDREPFSYLPGQFARLILGNGVSRDFSMANLPGEDPLLEFFIRIYPDGKFSSYIANAAYRGEALTVRGPRGKFILRDSDRTPVFIAGGTGLAPVAAMLRHLAETDPQRPAVLIFGNTNTGDVFFGEDLKDLRERLPRLIVHSTVMNPDPAWGGDAGLVTEVAERVLDQPGQLEYYYCGPPAMIEATTRLLERLGVAREYMHHEDFVPSERENDG